MPLRFHLLTICAAIVLLAGPAQAQPPTSDACVAETKRIFLQGLEWFLEREAVHMARDIARERMGPMDGWFRPSQSRYGWKWLASRFDKDNDGSIFPKELPGISGAFATLDRDGNGAITATDLDWSPAAPYLKDTALAGQWFGRTDADANGRISRQEWDALFDKLAKGKDYLTSEDLKKLLPPAPPPKGIGKGKDPSAKGSSGMPSPATMMHGLLTGEIGSLNEGPRPGQRAPDFTLPTHDGTRQIALKDFRGKPVVLIFGSFT
ncbi:MAG: redoxin domain-containing protein [Gemmataceae bacterium]|nr:redoxin domain-containing protein [Gemmataceae bacterium]MCI0737882.1 redoxin domain-containing protein [Gemmataceae bacterium]